MIKRSKWYVYLLVLLISKQAAAQETILYTDYKPVYSQWKKNYILDKIVYTEQNTIFHFRYVGIYALNSITLFGNLHVDKWCLEEVGKKGQIFCLEKLVDVAQDGKIVFPKIENSYQQHFVGKYGVIFTCKIYFPRLPNHITQVHLWEGLQKKRSHLNFHCLNVAIKPFDSPELGTEADLEERLLAFSEVLNLPAQIQTPKQEEPGEEEPLEEENKAAEEERP